MRLSPSGSIAAIFAVAMGASLYGANAEEKPFVVQAGAPVPYTGFLSVYVGQQAGFFKEEGLNVEVRYASGGPQATQIVAANQADASLATVEPVINGYDKGIRGKIFARTNAELIYYIAVPEDSPIKTLADLKGKKVGVASFASAAVPVVKSMLRVSGVDVQSDTLLPVGVMDQAMTALNSGKVQALGLYDGMYYALERAGFKFRYLHHPTLAGFGNSGLFASNDTIKSKKQELCAFGRAFAKATLFADANPEAAVRLYWKAVPSARRGANDEEAMKIGLAEVKPMLRARFFKFPPEGKYGVIDEEGFKKYIDMNKQEGVVANAPPVDAISTNEFIDCMNEWNSADVLKKAKEWKP
jgi:NitT/TauT family transport system substrate-binding protein